MVSRISLLLAPLAMLAGLESAHAFGHHRGCGSCCAVATCGACGTCQTCQTACKTVEKTIMVPTMVTENRTVQVVECTTEQRERTYTVNHLVPETHTVSYDYCVMVPETRTRTVNYTVCKPVMETKTREYTVMVPHTETKHGTKQVCKLVPVKMTRTVCEDHGHWESVPVCQPCAPANCCTSADDQPALKGNISLVGFRHHCGGGCATGCGSCGASCAPPCMAQHWVPNLVTREVEYTCYKAQMETVPCDYCVTVCTPEKRTCNVQVCNYVQEPKSCEVQYTVCVQQKKTGTREVTTCKCVPEEKKCTYTVQVPHTVEKQVTVQVCKMVPKTVTCTVPACGSCCN